MPLTVKGRRVSKDYLIEHGIIDDYFAPIKEEKSKDCTYKDTIKRQDAIDVLEEWCRANGYSNTVLISELNRSIGDLIRLPSAQQWIPCSKRLPKKSGQYYVSGGGKVWICEFLIIPNFTGGWCNNAVDPVVKAWMPLPEPYKGR